MISLFYIKKSYDVQIFFYFSGDNEINIQDKHSRDNEKTVRVNDKNGILSKLLANPTVLTKDTPEHPITAQWLVAGITKTKKKGYLLHP